MEHCRACKSNSYLTSQKMPLILCNYTLHYRIVSILTLIRTLNEVNPFQTITFCSYKSQLTKLLVHLS
jgi:hypothetical protein